jgi:hypothetical protein
MTPLDALRWLEEHMVPAYPLEDFKVCPSLLGLKF